MTECAGAILAGGKSTRMGSDKARLGIHGQTMLGFMENIFQCAGINKTYISRTNFIADIIPDCGPLSGIHAVLKQDDQKHAYIIFAAIDMPGLTPDILSALINAPVEADLVYYRSHKFPFRVRVKKDLCTLTENLLKNKSDLSLGHFQDLLENKLILDPDEINPHSFVNINTPQDWLSFKKGAAQ